LDFKEDVLKLFELIEKNAIIMDLKAKNKEAVFRELIEALYNSGKVSKKEKALSDLINREKKGTTSIGQRLAIPHVCTEAVHQHVIAFGRSKKGIEFEAMDKRPVSFIFLLLGPKIGANFNLKILGRLAHLLSIESFRKALFEVENKEDLYKLFEEQKEIMEDIGYPEDLPFICVVGSGNGGMAMAAHLSLLGCRVNLLSRRQERLAPIKASGGIYAYGEIEGFARLNIVTTNIKKAISGVDIIMIVTLANIHGEIAKLLGPYLEDGQIVILNPGRTGGALEFAQVLRQIKIKSYPFIGEAQTLLYASRITNPAQVQIFRIKNSVPVATLPAYHIPDVLANIRRVLPQFIPGDNVLKTGLDNVGAVFHPALTILNTAWIEETHGDFEYYHSGASRSVAKILESLDEERVAVAAALGIRTMTAREWLYLAYGVAGSDLYEAMQANPGYSGIKAPITIEHRYITEDVPMSLVPIASLAEHLGVKVPTIKSFIHLASVLHKRNYWEEGRTISRLGLSGLSVKQIRRLVEEGLENER
jgi:opine dehydrogenase